MSTHKSDFSKFRTLVKRAVYSVVGNISRVGLTLAADLLLARALGPESWGAYSYEILSAFIFLSVLESGAGAAFFTAIARRNRSLWFLFRFYLFLSVLFLLGASAVLLSLPLLDQCCAISGNSSRVVTIFSFVFLSRFVFTSSASIGEALGKTASAQVIIFATSLSHFVSVFVFLKTANVDVMLITSKLTLIYAVSSIFTLSLYMKFFKYPNGDYHHATTLRTEFKEYFDFMLPLAAAGLLGSISFWLIRWDVVKFGGHKEIGYFNIALQISSVFLLPVAGVSRLLLKEVANADEKNDHRFLHNVLTTFDSVGVHSMAFIIAVGVVLAQPLVGFILGSDYTSGIDVFVLGALQAFFQVQGQFLSIMVQGIGITKRLLQANLIPAFIILILVVLHNLFKSDTLRIPNIASAAMIVLIFSQLISVTVLRAKLYNLLSVNSSNHKSLIFLFFYLALYIGVHAFFRENSIIGDSYPVLKFVLIPGVFLSVGFLLFRSNIVDAAARLRALSIRVIRIR